MTPSLINPQKPSTLNQDLPVFGNAHSLETELQQYLTEGDPSKIAVFLQKHPGFLLHRADETLNLQLQAIYTDPLAASSLGPAQDRLLQDIHYLCRLDHQLATLSLPGIYQSRKEVVNEITSLIPKKNYQLRQEAHNRIVRRLTSRHLNEQCRWLQAKEAQITQGLEKALSHLFYEGFQIENENPRYLESAIRYTLPVLEHLGPHLQKVADLSQRAVLLATQIGRVSPALATRTNQINTQGQLAPLRSNAGISSTIEIYSSVYEHLLERPLGKAIQQEIQRDKHKEAAELAYLPYHPLLHGRNQ